jgi:hypothetical protein
MDEVAIDELGWDTTDYRRYVDEVYLRLDQDPPLVELPRPLRARLTMRCWGSGPSRRSIRVS